MRYIYCTMAVCLFCGCQGNTTALRNPFMSPDRVPPPATRIIAPGTAHPYYSGDVVPGSVGTPATGVTPPGGWGSPPQSSVTPSTGVYPASAEISLGPIAASNEAAIAINGDQQEMRFAQPQVADAGNWTPPVPQQTLSQQSQTQQSLAQQAVYQAPVVPSQFAAQTQYLEAPIQEAQRAVRIRAVESPASGANVVPSQDGFRPQGSSRNRAAASESNVNFSTPGKAPQEFGPVREDVQRFGFDPQYQWLRGQIQYTQATNVWHLRYIPVQGGVDQYGGQVQIANPHLLGGLQPGDYVQVQGQLQAQTNAPGAAYMVSIVQRQRVQ